MSLPYFIFTLFTLSFTILIIYIFLIFKFIKKNKSLSFNLVVKNLGLKWTIFHYMTLTLIYITFFQSLIYLIEIFIKRTTGPTSYDKKHYKSIIYIFISPIFFLLRHYCRKFEEIILKKLEEKFNSKIKAFLCAYSVAAVVLFVAIILTRLFLT